MSPRRPVPSIRLRLTAWYTVVLSLMLVVYAAATFVTVRHEFLEQLDHDLHGDFEAAEGLMIRTPQGGLAGASDRHHDPDNDTDRVSDAWSASGEQIYRSSASAALPAPALRAVATQPHYQSIVANDHRWRTLTGAATVGGLAVVLRVARSEDRLRTELWEILTVLVFGLPASAALAGVGGYVLARRALNPIDQIADEARRIT
ncbi:MAG: hypothetical protein HYS05_06270, partial [Acidobacteria bacterium]|nr:hypothetical protein [Acidobacteriota bacterium]